MSTTSKEIEPAPLAGELLDEHPLVIGDEAVRLDRELEQAAAKVGSAHVHLVSVMQRVYEGRSYLAMGYDTAEAYFSARITIAPEDANERKMMVEAMRGNGFTQRTIAEVLGVSTGTVAGDCKQIEASRSNLSSSNVVDLAGRRDNAAQAEDDEPAAQVLDEEIYDLAQPVQATIAIQYLNASRKRLIEADAFIGFVAKAATVCPPNGEYQSITLKFIRAGREHAETYEITPDAERYAIVYVIAEDGEEPETLYDSRTHIPVEVAQVESAPDDLSSLDEAPPAPVDIIDRIDELAAEDADDEPVEVEVDDAEVVEAIAEIARLATAMGPQAEAVKANGAIPAASFDAAADIVRRLRDLAEALDGLPTTAPDA
jgi:hypothetical protein